MVISDQNISTSVFDEIRTILVAADLKVTNSTTSAETSASIVASFNDKDPSRPQVVINPIDYDKGRFKFGDNQGGKFIRVVVECYYKNTLGIDQLSDQVDYAISEATVDGMEMVGVTTDYAFNLNNDNKYHQKSVQFTFDRE